MSGGRGQPGVSLVNRVKQYFDPAVLSEYRMVMFDQRGTGPAGINCAELQAAVGGADFVTPPRERVEACAAQLGRSRDLYGTPDTVEGIDWAAPRARRPTAHRVDGVACGTFSGAQYALRHPAMVRSRVLDSVVPLDGFDPLPTCTTDPVADLAWLLQHGEIEGQPINGTSFVEGLAIMRLSTVNPTFTGIPQMRLRATRFRQGRGLTLGLWMLRGMVVASMSHDWPSSEPGRGSGLLWPLRMCVCRWWRVRLRSSMPARQDPGSDSSRCGAHHRASPAPQQRLGSAGAERERVVAGPRAD